MDLLDKLLTIDNGQVVGEIARALGLWNEAALEAVSRLIPALSRGLDRNAAQPEGLEELVAVQTLHGCKTSRTLIIRD